MSQAIDRMNKEGLSSYSHSAAIKEAVLSATPWKYLAELNQQVVAALNMPDMINDRDFTYAIYLIDREIRDTVEKKRIAEAVKNGGFLLAEQEILSSLVGKKCQRLSLPHCEVQDGTIKPDGRGSFLFIPKGKRTHGFFPRYVKEAA